MSDSPARSVFVPNYQEARIIHWAFGQRQPGIVQGQLRAYGIEVPLSLIRQLALDPQLRDYKLTTTDIVQSFRLFRLIVEEWDAVKEILNNSGITVAVFDAGITPDALLRLFVGRMFRSEDLGKEPVAAWIPDDLLALKYLKAAAQLSYMVELKSSAPYGGKA